MGIFDRNQPDDDNPRPSPGRGIGARLVMALMIALVAWLMYMNQVEVNPVTGEKQHVAITPDQEIRLGIEAAPSMSAEMGGELPDSDPRARVVTQVGNYIIKNSDAKKSPWKFDFHLLADPDTVNAFALPGGQIFITLGLYDKLQTEAQLGGVLSHEIGHVIERHTAQQMAKSRLGQMLVVAAGSAAADNSSQYGNNSAAMIASFVNQMFQLRYSRGDESEADLWGLKLMEQVGYNPVAMIEVMEILKAAGGKGMGPEMFQTHPNPDLRIQQIKEYLKAHPAPQGGSEGANLRRAK